MWKHGSGLPLSSPALQFARPHFLREEIPEAGILANFPLQNWLLHIGVCRLWFCRSKRICNNLGVISLHFLFYKLGVQFLPFNLYIDDLFCFIKIGDLWMIRYYILTLSVWIGELVCSRNYPWLTDCGFPEYCFKERSEAVSGHDQWVMSTISMVGKVVGCLANISHLWI